MRNIYRKLEQEGEQLILKQQSSGHNRATTFLEQKDLEKRKTQLSKDGVGELEERGEFGLGMAPRTAKPIHKIELSKAKEEEIAKMQEEEQPQIIEEEDESQMEIIRLKQ